MPRISFVPLLSLPCFLTYGSCVADIVSQLLPKMPAEFSRLFDSRSIIMIPPRSGGMSDSERFIQIPVGSYGDLDTVEFGTTLVIMLAFVVLLRTSFKLASRLTSVELHAKVE